MTHWAIFVGINFYIDPKECLEGCVPDILAAQKQFAAAAAPAESNVTVLTATKPSDNGSQCPLEEPDVWPTAHNLNRALKKIIQEATEGDTVYFYYSGHGTRRPTNDNSLSAGNLALVLFEPNEYGKSYYPGQHLAGCLRLMVAKRLRVTVVLDCCFSGSVLRSDNKACGTRVRAIPWNSVIAIASESLVDQGFDTVPLRTASVEPGQWLVNPDGYTILAACGPHEIAQELSLDSGEKRGALSYFLEEAVRDLRRRGTTVTHLCLYDQLCIQFRAAWPRQTPMRYGNPSWSFLLFGNASMALGSRYVRIFWRHDQLLLDAGEAHGVRQGDQFAASRFDPSTYQGSSETDQAVIVRVKSSRGLTSTLEMTSTKSAKTQPRIETGWLARPISSLSSRKTAVRLLCEGSLSMDRGLSNATHRWLRLCGEEEDVACAFQVTINEEIEYEVLNASGERICSLPTIPVSRPHSDCTVLAIVQHVAQYQYFQGLENQTPNQDFEDRFSIHVQIDNGTSSTNTNGFTEVIHGGSWSLTVRNNSENSLYMSLFNLTQSWKVCNLLIDDGDNEFGVIQPKEHVTVPLEMEVPPSVRARGEDHCEDVIKLFITSKASTFPTSILSDISVHIDLERAPSGDPLVQFLSTLITPFRDTQEELWACRNFIIRTSMPANDH